MSLKDTINIMVVDDMSVSRALISQALDDMGVKRYTAENDAAAAFQKLVGAPVHLVISDMNMPGMDGLQFLSALRNNKMTQRIGFILITSTPSNDVVQKCHQLGANNLVRKPFTTPSLKTSIERVVGPL